MKVCPWFSKKWYFECCLLQVGRWLLIITAYNPHKTKNYPFNGEWLNYKIKNTITYIHLLNQTFDNKHIYSSFYTFSTSHTHARTFTCTHAHTDVDM